MSAPATLQTGDGPCAGGAPGTCDRCGVKRAAYTRKYSGQSLCTGCFRRSISRKVAKTVSKYDMIRDGDRVAVAVSGGKDSLALLQIMHEMSQGHNFGIDVITIDEGIPGYRDEALGIVSDVCGSLGVGHRVYAYKDLFEVSLDEALDMRQRPQDRQKGARGMSSCSICGTLRRRAIDIAAADVGADAVATGHNLDDMLQTFLINMLSGDTDKIAWMGPGGATGAAAGAGGRAGASPRRIKPFCEIYESEIVFYAFASGLPFQQEPCPHMNEGIRTEIREFLNSLESERSGIKNSMYASVLRIVQMAHGRGVTPGLREADGPNGAADTPATTIPAPPEYAGKRRSSCTRCGASCTGGAGGVCSVCETMARLGRISR